MIYLLDKQSGWTSFDLVKKVRGIISEKEGKKVKVGHAGTLDPLATGLMIVATGHDTKKLNELTGLDKTYVAEFLLGRKTDTADQEGQILQENFELAQKLEKEQINEAVEKLEGSHELSVPLYSAVKVEGKPLYRYARNNQTPPRIPVREMRVYESKLIEVTDSFGVSAHSKGILVRLEVSVASGVYIRSLSEHLGQLLGVPAMMWSLRRIKIGEYDISQATIIEDLIQDQQSK